jgi:phosphatidylserine/phosphatidylglycerophosphate/cardiolipin synthase-like enzyme
LILYISILGTVTTLLFIQNNRSTCESQSMEPYRTAHTERVLEKDVKARPLIDPAEIMDGWKRVILTATKTIRFCTFRWRFCNDKGDIDTPHILKLGQALCELDETLSETVDVRILINKMIWVESSSSINNHIKNTLKLWKQLKPEGFKFVKVEFRAFPHWLMDNIHAKLVTSDDGDNACVFSMNVEPYSNGSEKSWYEAGVELSNAKNVMKKTIDTYDYYWYKSNIIEQKYCEVGMYNINTTPRNPTKERPVFSVTAYGEANVIQSNALKSDRLLSDTSRAVIERLNQAKESILIMSPNFNDSILWNLIKTSTAKDVRIISGKGFNTEIDTLQRIFVGFTSNVDFFKKAAKESVVTRFKYYGQEGEPVIGKTDYAVHSKMSLIDGEWTMLGSFNHDIFSTMHSFENIVMIQSKEFNNYMKKNWFEPNWNRGVYAP